MIARMISIDNDLDDWFKKHREYMVSHVCNDALRIFKGTKEELQTQPVEKLSLDEALQLELKKSLDRKDWFKVQRIKHILDIRAFRMRREKERELKESPPVPPKENLEEKLK